MLLQNGFFIRFCGLLTAFFSVMALFCSCSPKTAPVPEKRQRLISGIGYVRGSGAVTLKNKYAGFVSKVNFYSQQRVKKGDVILTYDDYEIRKKISDKKHEILLQKEEIAYKELVLQRIRLDPLPNNFRNLQYKLNAAQALYLRLKHEEEVYDRLYQAKCVSNLSWQEKKQSARSSEADLKQIMEDQDILRKGLSELYIKIAEQELQTGKVKLFNLEQNLKLLEEEQKYYSIVAPCDGLCITNSDTVHGYNTVGTPAAVVHKDRKKYVYAYFRDSDVGKIKENVSCFFRSNQYPDTEKPFTLVPFKVTKDRSSYGDNCYYLVEFRVVEEHKPLRIDSIGRVEVAVSEEK